MKVTASPLTDNNMTDIGHHNKKNEPSSSSNPPLPPVDTIFVWDFDWTIVDCNSDEYVPSKFLGDADTNRRFHQLIRTLGPTRWHECVSSLIDSCAEERGCSERDIREAAASMPYLVGVRGSLEDVAGDAKCGQAIISDGNDVFIGAFLKNTGIERYFSHGIETNLGNWEDVINNGDDDDADDDANIGKCGTRFNVVYQSSKYGGHSCKTCPPNLCKSGVLIDITSRIDDHLSSPKNAKVRKRPRIVYIGDGSNDACPALHVLNEGDILLARDGRKINNPNSRTGLQEDTNYDADDLARSSTDDTFPILSTLKRAEAREGLVPKCSVRAWNSGRELRSLIRNILDET